MCAALDADLKRFYGERLKGLYTTPRQLTYRELIWWIRHLPSDSALARRGEAGELVSSMQERLLAGINNELRIGNFYYVSKNSDSKLEHPDLIDLP